MNYFIKLIIYNCNYQIKIVNFDLFKHNILLCILISQSHIDNLLINITFYNNEIVKKNLMNYIF